MLKERQLVLGQTAPDLSGCSDPVELQLSLVLSTCGSKSWPSTAWQGGVAWKCAAYPPGTEPLFLSTRELFFVATNSLCTEAATLRQALPAAVLLEKTMATNNMEERSPSPQPGGKVLLIPSARVMPRTLHPMAGGGQAYKRNKKEVINQVGEQTQAEKTTTELPACSQ
ncbi:uncharacterized protein LOC128327619 isoform X2 [Hemicordylus capensis]|uniref:uncharacterized protein LOC128327619 isoform X2 n=1 Tax=Hemicordylus capensis TaxID=884348 RepID=UPI0023042FD2|nr:uncharacterized protein LOC128327619 isoform X2 [Hemicordylus capensis]